jgi:hypothetical protein
MNRTPALLDADPFRPFKLVMPDGQQIPIESPSGFEILDALVGGIYRRGGTAQMISFDSVVDVITEDDDAHSVRILTA